MIPGDVYSWGSVDNPHCKAQDDSVRWTFRADTNCQNILVQAVVKTCSHCGRIVALVCVEMLADHLAHMPHRQTGSRPLRSHRLMCGRAMVGGPQIVSVQTEGAQEQKTGSRKLQLPKSHTVNLLAELSCSVQLSFESAEVLVEVRIAPPLLSAMGRQELDRYFEAEEVRPNTARAGEVVAVRLHTYFVRVVKHTHSGQVEMRRRSAPERAVA